MKIRFFCILSENHDFYDDDNEDEYDPDVRHYISKDWVEITKEMKENIDTNLWNVDTKLKCPFEINYEILPESVNTSKIPTDAQIFEKLEEMEKARLSKIERDKKKAAAAKEAKKRTKEEQELATLERLKAKYESK